MLRIYLDNCCYNRPYDDQSQIMVNLEAQAKLHIQEQIRSGKYELVASDMLNYEMHQSPYELREKMIADFARDNARYYVGSERSDLVEQKANEIMETGIKYKDACHIASAIIADCNYFISTDYRLLRYVSDKIKIVNPVDFIREEEETHE